MSGEMGSAGQSCVMQEMGQGPGLIFLYLNLE